MPRYLLVAVLVLSACRTVVTTTTEIRPSRYAVLEFTRLVSPDSVVAYAKRAVTAENLKVRSVDQAAATVTAGPRLFARTDSLPALEAQVTISAEASGPETRVRIVVSSPVEAGQRGGVDARLMQMAQQIEQRLEAAIH